MLGGMQYGGGSARVRRDELLLESMVQSHDRVAQSERVLCTVPSIDTCRVDWASLSPWGWALGAARCGRYPYKQRAEPF
jgi:hypothetical protein